jgi:hypothetical protein
LSSINRSPIFRIAYAVLSTIALAIAARYFLLAIPLFDLDIKLSRTEAITQAQELAPNFKLAPAGARIAARFDHDGRTQNFVELEGGSQAAFAELTRGDVYSPHY